MGKFIGYESVSYERATTFTLNKQNRAYNPAHLEKVKRETLDSLDVMPPITVNVVTNNIIDGQHRHKSFIDLSKSGSLPKNSELKVMWVSIPKEKELEAIVKANTNSKNWTLDNYIASHINSGNEFYVKLDEWCKAHALSSESGKSKIRYGAAMISGRRNSPDLKRGTFTFTEQDIQRAEEVHTELLGIVEMFGMKGRGMWIEALTISWIAVREQHDFETWMKAFKSKRSEFLKMPKDNSKDWNNIFAQAHLAIDMKNK